MHRPWESRAVPDDQELFAAVLTCSDHAASMAKTVLLHPERRAAVHDEVAMVRAVAAELAADIPRMANKDLRARATLLLSEARLDLLFVELETPVTSLRLARFRSMVGRVPWARTA